MRARCALIGAAFAAAAGLATSAHAGLGIPTVIYSDIVSSSTSNIPGLAGQKFLAFDRPYRSPDGSRWIIQATVAGATSTTDELLLVGGGLAGAVAVREGQEAPWAAPEILNGGIRRNLGINDAGQFGFSANTDASTTADEYIVRGDLGKVFNTIAKEGTAAPAIPGGTTFGTTMYMGSMLNDGKAAFRAAISSPPAGFGTTGLFIGEDLVANTANASFAPSNQLTGLTENWSSFDIEDFYANAAGTSWITSGSLTGSTASNVVVAVNNSVVIQEGFPLPGTFPANVTSAADVFMMSNGDWFARGSLSDTTDYVVRNGSVVARTDDAVPGGLPGETYDDTLFTATFFAMTGNNTGDYVFGATTSNPDPAFDAVLVLNGSLVVARQGDAVDLNGDGLFNDDAFIDVFNNDDVFLTDDLTLHFTADLRDSTGAGIGQAFIAQQIPAPGGAALLGLAGLVGLRRRR